MNDWTSGYVADVGYTFGYYNELNPARLIPAFLDAGLVPPVVNEACELGFGQGMSVNIHAATGSARWWGTDFNPAQAAFAQELADVSGVGARLFDASFAEFAARDDLPQFDYIGLHGIWTWVSDQNREVIVDFVRRKLKIGGVLYVSYNTQPGWAPIVPLRDLLTEHAERMTAPARGIASRIEGALAFADKLFAANPAFVRVNPQLGARLKQIKEQNRNYLAHEYFNRDWQPMSFSRMMKLLAPAKLDFACSAHYFDHIDQINLSPEQQALLNEIPDICFRETVRDFFVNQYFRRDYWVKGSRRLSAAEQSDAFRKLAIMLVQPRDEVSLTVNGAAGKVTMQQHVYGPVLDALADHCPHTVGEIESCVAGINFAQLRQAIMVLFGTGSVQPVQDPAVTARYRSSTDKLNAAILEKSEASGDIGYLASPLTGGVSVSRFLQLFLLARAGGSSDPDDWARFAWRTIAAQGQRLVKEGKGLEGEQENLAELTRMAHEFASKRLPILAALQVT